VIEIKPSAEDMDGQAHAHTRFAEEIADRVEQRLIAKFAKWVIINLGVLVTSVAIGIAAYYNHESRISTLAQVDIVSEKQIAAMAIEHGAIRASLGIELREINARLDEINRYLRDSRGGR
jgi:chromosome condensin MukBEF complex kleisin-like MukF subunit